MKPNEEQNPLAPCLTEDLRALEDVEEARVSPAFRARWRAALPQRRRRVPQGALALAAAVLIVLGGVLMQRAGTMPSLRNVTVPAKEEQVEGTAEGNEKATYALSDDAPLNAQGGQSAPAFNALSTGSPTQPPLVPAAESAAMEELALPEEEDAFPDEDFALPEAESAFPDEEALLMDGDEPPIEDGEEAFAGEAAALQEAQEPLSDESARQEEASPSEGPSGRNLRFAAFACILAGAALFLCLGIQKVRRRKS